MFCMLCNASSVELLKLTLKRLAVCPKENLTCGEWHQHNSNLWMTWSNLLATAFQVQDPESFLRGACFGLPNLKTQIMSVRLPESSHHDLTSLQGPDDLEASQDDQAETAGISRLCRPQYSPIKDILVQAQSQTVLDVFEEQGLHFG